MRDYIKEVGDKLKENQADVKFPVSIGLSADGSAVMVNGVEVSANCHLCTATEKFALDTHKLIAYNKPKRWALHYGGTPKNPKRFFICDTCAKAICNEKR